ncbi:MAG: CpsD/CapB family tyrosine-protein kinase [Pseudomonadota bacterium]
MDRLQAAIAKARISREAGAGPVPVLVPDVPVATKMPVATVPQPAHAPVQLDVALPAPGPSIAERWSKLPKIEIASDTLARARVVTREGGPKTAPFDVLRTRVTQLMQENDWKRLCITSPGPECGKSTVTLNLAYSLARHQDLRIVVVDLDLRRPSLAPMLGVASGRDVSRVLEGRAALADNIVRVSENLAFVTAGRPAKNPSELLQGRRTRDFLDQLDAEFAPDIVLYDLPPMMVSDDALGFIPLVDCALLISAAEQSTIKQVDTCEKELASRTNVLGVVLNKCEYPDNGSNYGYGYGDYAQIA